MNISLTPELEAFVSAQLATGHYRSASEVVREALRNQIRLGMAGQVEQRIALSRQQVSEGRVTEVDDAYFESKRARIRAKYIDESNS